MTIKKQEFFLFTDGSVNTQSKVGYGACLLVSDLEQSIESLKTQVKLKCFEQTSSSKLELQTLLWALNEPIPTHSNITIFTDSQNIISLPERRNGFEQNNYLTGKNKLHNNHLLYQEFYKMVDSFDCQFVKIQGHQPSRQKDNIEKIFALVDVASRNAVRNISG